MSGLFSLHLTEDGIAALFSRRDFMVPRLLFREIKERWLVHITTVIFSAARVSPV